MCFGCASRRSASAVRQAVEPARQGLDQTVGDEPVEGPGTLHRLVPHAVERGLRYWGCGLRGVRRAACRVPDGPCPRRSGRAAAGPSCSGLPGELPGALGGDRAAVRRLAFLAVQTSAPSSMEAAAQRAAVASSAGNRARASLRSAAVVAFGGYWTPVDGAGEDPADVRVQHGVPLPVGEGGHGRGGVLADAGQGEQLGVLAWVRRRRGVPLWRRRRRAGAGRGAGSRAGPRRGRPRPRGRRRGRRGGASGRATARRRAVRG